MRLYLRILSALTVLVVPFPTGRLPIDVPTVPHRTTTLGYDRAEFGPGWAAGTRGCDTRAAVMAAAFDADCAQPLSLIHI